MDEIVLKFVCIWCTKTVRVTIKDDRKEIDIDNYRVCVRCKLEREHAVHRA